jgi:hypothetical protein
MNTLSDFLKRHWTLMALAASGGLMALCYGYALGLPFFYDDLPIMTWLRSHDLLDIWTHSSENAFYRPLAFTIYKIGLMLPQTTRQVALHAVSLLLHWLNSALVMRIVQTCDHSRTKAVIAAALFTVFPFVYLAVTWVTALSHPLVLTLTLIAAYAALEAERTRAIRWWAVSLLATLLAPFAHESGPACSVIVAGMVLIQYGLRSRRQVTSVLLGVILNAGALLLRSTIPGTGSIRFEGLTDWLQNLMYFAHGLVYPVAPAVGWLVREHGLHDFTLVGLALACLLITVACLAILRKRWRWAPRSLWWWAIAAAPAGASLSYGYLYASPRMHALPSAGIVMLWANIIVESASILRRQRVRHLVTALLVSAIAFQNVAFLRRQAALFSSLNTLYQRILTVSERGEDGPTGFVNVPSSLAWKDRVYALNLETVLFVPSYSSLGEFIEVNDRWRGISAIMFTPVLQSTGQYFGFQGEGLDWGQMRSFAARHDVVWLTSQNGSEYALREAGTVLENAVPEVGEPLVRFETGPIIESAHAARQNGSEWAIRIVWFALAPYDGDIFVHVRNEDGVLVGQADGPALAGVLPIWIWQPGDRVVDVRTVSLPADGAPFRVEVGVYNDAGRLQAYSRGARSPESAPTILTILP